MAGSATHPVCVLLVSGKRKCGKDFVTDALLDKIGGDVCAVVKISAPIKQHWSKEMGLSFEELMSPDRTKEHHRKAMIEWSDSVRVKDPGYFCRAAVNLYKAHSKPIWIVSDTRRKTDVDWFNENYNSAVLTLRITAPEAVRQQRGWTFTPGIDDVESECGLDAYSSWNETINNDGKADTGLLIDSVIGLLAKHNSATAQLLNHLLKV